MKKWFSAMRLRTLPLAASCTLMGSALGWHEANNPWLLFSLSLITTCLLQILSNMANDYGDFASGVDNDKRVGPRRAMQSGSITKSQMQYALVVCASLSLVSGLVLLWSALASHGLFFYAILFFVLGVGAIAAAFKYTVGKNPYGYRGLGDVFVFLFFGIVGVCGTYFLFTKTWNWWTLLPAITIGALSCAVLNLNNMRDHVNDAASRKRTLVVLFGFEKSKIYHSILIVAAFASLLYYSLFNGGVPFSFRHWWQWLCFAPFILVFKNLITVVRCTTPASLDPELKKVALSTFLISLLVFISAMLC
ncbi:MAG: 1,4-dihydroxy-2-naphthoate octaprenyltransferase [Flavobacteriales bacterium]